MISYWIGCTRCGTELLHGTVEPPQPQYCSTARVIRQNCRARGCDLKLTQKDEPLALVDQIRLGLVDEAAAWQQLREAARA